MTWSHRAPGPFTETTSTSSSSSSHCPSGDSTESASLAASTAWTVTVCVAVPPAGRSGVVSFSVFWATCPAVRTVTVRAAWVPSAGREPAV
ncbi:hypothetical protein [Streptomyces wuyuanensis]|uniref:hypothetical protein n=1 Tax=Streptomyces wuyuanensis TaxID=1196353 RepID=UPI0034350BCD